MNHATADELSAYLDRELPSGSSEQIEEHLETCDACLQHLESMRRVVHHLRHLERMAPPPTLGQVVARRVALDRDREGMLDRLESGLDVTQRQSPFLVLFGVVIALATIVLLFAQALDRSRFIPVLFQDPAPAAAPASPERQELAGRLLVRSGEVWIEEGIEQAAVRRVVELGSPAARELLSRHPELNELAQLQAPVVLRIDSEILEVRPALPGSF